MFVATLWILHFISPVFGYTLFFTLGHKEGWYMKHLVGGWSIFEHLFVLQFYLIIFPKKHHFLLKKKKKQLIDKLSLFMLSLGDTLLKKNEQMILSLQRKEATENGTIIKIQDFKGK